MSLPILYLDFKKTSYILFRHTSCSGYSGCSGTGSAPAASCPRSAQLFLQPGVEISLDMKCVLAGRWRRSASVDISKIESVLYALTLCNMFFIKSEFLRIKTLISSS
jgi:hypothetical protein